MSVTAGRGAETIIADGGINTFSGGMATLLSPVVLVQIVKSTIPVAAS
jgi:hypothetical protein